MKGKEIIEHINRAKMPDIEQVRENCVLLAAPKKQETKRRFYRRYAAVAAVLIACLVFGNTLFTLRSNNAFTLKAYAMEQEDDGAAELHKLFIPNRYYDNRGVFYLSVALKCDSENIESVEFFMDGARFAEQYLIVDDKKISQTFKSFCVDSDTARSVVNVKFYLDKNTANGEVRFVTAVYGQDAISQITISAVATFTDGKTQQKTITLKR